MAKFQAGATKCAWFMVPPSIWDQIVHGILNIGHPSFSIAVAKYACGEQAIALRQKGYKAFATKADAENAVNQANQNANKPPPGPLTEIADFFHRLTEKATWTRVGEVILGAGLLFIGAHAIFRGSEAQSAVKSVTRPVKKVAKTGVRVVAPELTPAVRATKARAKIAAKHPPPTRKYVRESHVYHHTGPKKVKP